MWNRRKVSDEITVSDTINLAPCWQIGDKVSLSACLFINMKGLVWKLNIVLLQSVADFEMKARGQQGLMIRVAV